MSGMTPARALVISPAFFGYERDIVAELEAQGFQTTFLDERLSNSAVARSIMRVRKNLVGRRIEAYFRRKQAEFVRTRFSLVVVIKAEVVPRWFLQDLRSANPDARFVFYTYDAIDNASNCLEVLDLFDERLSFDRVDVEKHPDFSYLPLFYTPEFQPLALERRSGPRRLGLSFIGTLHTERYAFATKLFGSSQNAYGFFYVQARWYFAVIKYLTREHANVPWKAVSFTSLNRSQIAEVFRQSHAVLDMQRIGQAGLTMRTFEVLASGAILVTTNSAISREPFFDPSRIVVVPASPEDLDADKVRAAIQELAPPDGPPAGFESYALSNWVRRLTTSGQA